MRGDLELKEKEQIEERLIEVRRVFKVHKGGRRAAFRALVVVGNGKGEVGAATGKALDVPEAIRKGYEAARKQMIKVPLIDTTIPHEVVGKCKSSMVVLKPAARGTGVIAGTAVRAVLEAAGIRNVLSKVIGSRSKVNCVFATMAGLLQLRHPEEVAKMRGKSVEDLPLPESMRRRLKEDELRLQTVAQSSSSPQPYWSPEGPKGDS